MCQCHLKEQNPSKTIHCEHMFENYQKKKKLTVFPSSPGSPWEDKINAFCSKPKNFIENVMFF